MTAINSATATGASDPNFPRSMLFTCLACQVAFQAAEDQRTHYRTDWHRYNLKRKVAQLPPVTAEQFAGRVLAQQKASEEDAQGFKADCAVCKKTYYSENAHQNHLGSKRHHENEMRKKETVATVPVKATASAPVRVELVVSETATEMEIERVIDARIESTTRLSPDTDCLFCSHTSADLETNLTHMTRTHSFFIPDVEYLVDLRGLITYLGEKVAVGNTCLLCGRSTRSLEAVRQHMVDKGHCGIAYEREEDAMEVVDFYDFTSSYPPEMEKGEGDEGEGEDLDLLADTHGVRLTEDEMELVLPSGIRLGHRSLLKYYKQSLKPEESRDSVIINRLITQYGDEFGLVSPSGSRGKKTRGLIANGRTDEDRRHVDGFREQKTRKNFDVQVGVRANKLQHHFRQQIL